MSCTNLTSDLSRIPGVIFVYKQTEEISDEETDLDTVEPDFVMLAQRPERGCVADLVVRACVVGAVVVDAFS